MYWAYVIILKYSFINIYSKVLTILIPFILLEKLMELQLYSELNKTGELNIAFEVISIICNVFKNITARVVFYALSLGYALASR
jgi:hypothetical protein